MAQVIAPCRAVKAIRAIEGTWGASKVAISALTSSIRPPPSTMRHANSTASSTRRRLASRASARRVREVPTASVHPAGEMRTLWSGPANSKKRRWRSAPDASSATSIPLSFSGGAAPPPCPFARRPATSKKSYSSSGSVSIASRNARWIERSVSCVACSSWARLCASISPRSCSSSGPAASASAASAASCITPVRVAGVRLRNGASTIPCR